VFHIDLSLHRYYLCIRKLALPAFIPGHSQNNPWNNLPAIRLRVVMFRSEALLGVPIQFRGSIQRETLDNMVSALRRTFRILCNTFFTSRTGIAASRTVFLEDHQHALDTTDTSPTPEDNLIRLDNQAGLQRALEQLEPPLREALLLCDVEEVKYRDIALILDIPIGTVMSRISRARRALRQLLQLQLGECSSCLPGTAKLARDANFPRLLVSLKTLDKGNASANCGKWAKERFALRQTDPA
jgi:RNA polymerase sigma factor (sigma-70 family)